MRKIWNIKPPDAELEAKLASSLPVSKILARILINRGITDIDDANMFLNGDISSSFDPYLLNDMDKAVMRIKMALDRKEKILIYGDYDVDGITSIALLYKILSAMGGDIMTYIPHRIEEGYGLNSDAISFAKNKNVGLVITVDCGIDACAEVKFARELGLDVIITDHHEVKRDEIPPAYAILNPHMKGSDYPFSELAGVGVAYKLCQAMAKKQYLNIERHLDYVALGTISDIVPQRSENRVFTKHGLKVLNNTDKPGLRALIESAGISNREISSSDIGYILGPRINAMGRIGSADTALKLMLTGNKLEADKLASMLGKENQNRQKIESKILEEAMAKVEREINFKEHKIIIISEENWHPGVIGIVASRIQEKFYRPTIVISMDGNSGKGSGRSIDKFHLFEALLDSKDCLVDFGGHEAACGLTIKRDKLPKFRERINNYAKLKIKEDDLFPVLDIDVELPLSELGMGLLEELKQLSPYGPENLRPVFMSYGVKVTSEPRFIGRNGYKMWVRCGEMACEAVTFKRDNIYLPNPGDVLDIVYTPSINDWQGIESIQLDLKDIRLARSS